VVANFRELVLSDFQVDACCNWKAPEGVLYLPLPFVLPFYRRLGAGRIIPDVEISTPEFPFEVRVISSTGQTPGTLLQVQWPDGRYLSNPGFDLWGFVGTGRRGRLIDPYKLLPAASKIRLNFDNTNGAQADLELFFEGSIRVPLVKKK
jgi:hypothetical protein